MGSWESTADAMRVGEERIEEDLERLDSIVEEAEKYRERLAGWRKKALAYEAASKNHSDGRRMMDYQADFDMAVHINLVCEAQENLLTDLGL